MDSETNGDVRRHGEEAQRKTRSGSAREETVSEEFRVSGEAVTAKIRELLREGNVRRIIIKNEAGATLIEIPLTVGVVGTLLLPVWAGIGAIAALAANLTLNVERRVDTKVADDAASGGAAAPLDKTPPENPPGN